MGKGDRKTAKGKRYNASYGNARKNVAAKATGTANGPAVKKTAATKPAVTKVGSATGVKKAAAKKTAG